MQTENLPTIEHAFRQLADRLAWHFSLLLAGVLILVGTLTIVISSHREVDAATHAVWMSLQRLVGVGDRFYVKAEMASLVESGAIDSYSLFYQDDEEDNSRLEIAYSEEPNSSNEKNGLYLPFAKVHRKLVGVLPAGGKLELQVVRRLNLIPLLAVILLAVIMSPLIALVGRRHLRRLAQGISHPIELLSAILSKAKSPRDTHFEHLGPKLLPFRELAMVGHAFEKLMVRIEGYQSKELALERESLLGQIASQVAHDIRSPLTALKIVSEDFSDLTEQKRGILQGAIERIQDIATNLLEAHHRSRLESLPPVFCHNKEELSNEWIFGLVETLFNEKRMQYRYYADLDLRCKLDPSTKGNFSKVRASDFQRMLSNLIDNGVEAVEGAGTVEIALLNRGEMTLLTVTDNGKGLPQEVVGKLFERGVTFGKEKGSGLGLYHARSVVREWNGRINLTRRSEGGTEVAILLPRVISNVAPTHLYCAEPVR